MNEKENELEIAKALLAAREEVIAQREEKKIREHERAAQRFKENRAAEAKRQAELEWRKNHPATEEEKEENRRRIRELAEKCRRSKKDNK